MSLSKESRLLSIEHVDSMDDGPLPGFPKFEVKDETMDVEQKTTSDDLKEPKTPIICHGCGKEIPDPKDRACRQCGYYRPQPGETFDLSKVNWKLPQVICNNVQVRSVDNPHDLPFPGGFGEGDSINSMDCNMWVLNHLPLKEEEKKQLVDDIAQEKAIERTIELKAEKKKKSELTKSELVREGWQRRQQHGDDTDDRRSVKKNVKHVPFRVKSVNKEPSGFTALK